MILINDENLGCVFDLAKVQAQVKADIKQFLKNECNGIFSEESNDILTLLELRGELQGIKEMLESPFDILIVVKKEVVKGRWV